MAHLSSLTTDSVVRTTQGKGRGAEGKTKREIMRCLKRYLARQIYQTLTARPTPVDQFEPHETCRLTSKGASRQQDLAYQASKRAARCR